MHNVWDAVSLALKGEHMFTGLEWHLHELAHWPEISPPAYSLVPLARHTGLWIGPILLAPSYEQAHKSTDCPKNWPSGHVCRLRMGPPGTVVSIMLVWWALSAFSPFSNPAADQVVLSTACRRRGIYLESIRSMKSAAYRERAARRGKPAQHKQ